MNQTPNIHHGSIGYPVGPVCKNGHVNQTCELPCSACGELVLIQALPPVKDEDKGRPSQVPEGYHDHLDSSLTAHHDRP